MGFDGSDLRFQRQNSIDLTSLVVGSRLAVSFPSRRSPSGVSVERGRYHLIVSVHCSQAVEIVLEAFVFATILIGFFGIILKKNVLMKIISMDVMSTGVIACYVLVASKDGILTPIFDPGDRLSSVAGEIASYADPVPQAVILTAIVIGFSIQALMLVGVMKLAKNHPTLETREIERNIAP
jgi:multicomponent Na+:H+ antiporter subunit C